MSRCGFHPGLRPYTVSIVAKRRARNRRRKLILFTIFFVLPLLAAGYFGFKLFGSLGKGANLAQMWTGISNPRGLFPGQDRIVILVVGEDYNHDDRGFRYSKNNRSDTIMLLGLDFDKRDISAVSVPRDTFVRAIDGRTGKINGTFARGGMPLLRTTLEDIFKIEIDYTVSLRPDAVEGIVDAVGGVTVEAIDDMKYSDEWGGLDIDIPKGRHHLTGKEAEGFARFRKVKRTTIDSRGREVRIRGVKSSLEEGDLRRTARQQQLIKAMVSAAIRPGNLMRADQIIDTGFSKIETDLQRIQLLALATIFKDDPDFGGVTLPGRDETIGGIYYWVLDDRADRFVNWLIRGDQMAGRQAVRVSMKNGSGVSGAARIGANELRTMGFSPTVAGNAELQETSTVTFRQAAFQGMAAEIATALGLPAPVKEPPDPRYPYAPDIEVVVGKDQGEALRARADSGRTAAN